MATNIFRFGVSIDKALIDKFDALIEKQNYTNRSEAFRDLIRSELVKEQWSKNEEVAGAITLIYNHHRRELVKKLMDIQHDFEKLILCTQHVHLDHDNCLEIVAIKGNATNARELAQILKSVKGVKHSTLSMTGTGQRME